MKKNLWIKFSLVLVPIVPLAAVTSCSSWTKWSKKNTNPGVVEYEGLKRSVIDEQYKVRSDNELAKTYAIKKEIDKQSITTIDLKKVNNQFELIKIISTIMNMKSPERTDLYWNNMTDENELNDKDLLNYMTSIEKNIKIKFVHGGLTYDVNYDVEKIIEDMNTEYNNFMNKLGDNLFTKLKADKSNNEFLPSQITKQDIIDRLNQLLSKVKNDLQKSIDDPNTANSKKNANQTILNELNTQLIEVSNLTLEPNDVDGELKVVINLKGQSKVIYITWLKKNHTTSKHIANSLLDNISNINTSSTGQGIRHFFNSFRGNTPLKEYWDYIAAVQSGKKITPHDEVATIINSKLMDVEKRGISSKGIPIDFANVTKNAASLITIPAVSSLMRIDSNFSLMLSKLANLPRGMFGAFTSWLKSINKLMNDIYTTNNQNKALEFWLRDSNTSTQGVSWKIDLSLSSSGVFADESKQENNLINYNQKIKGIFLANNLR